MVLVANVMRMMIMIADVNDRDLSSRCAGESGATIEMDKRLLITRSTMGE